jgi:hypothetical protein
MAVIACCRFQPAADITREAERTGVKKDQHQQSRNEKLPVHPYSQF